MALRPMEDAGRYGTVTVDEDFGIIGFNEKGKKSGGLINGGIYALNTVSFKKTAWPEKFSFEKDFLEPYSTVSASSGSLPCLFHRHRIPEDYRKAVEEFAQLATE